jgi:hypothetical protein
MARLTDFHRQQARVVLEGTGVGRGQAQLGQERPTLVVGAESSPDTN